ncbi:MAG: hypothetical protein ACOCM4_06465, partial [Acetivibrio ethanolgignens]
MKAFYKKCLAALLTVAMILSMIPASVFAVQQTGTYSKISGVADLTSGKYVLVCENNRAAGAYDTDTKALPEQEQSVVENSIINPAESLVWNVVVSGSSISLQDSKGKYLTSGGNSSNSISAENTPYYWKVLGGTTFTFNEETGTKVLAYNTNTKYFRQYAATGTNPKNFTLYKFVEGSIAPATQADEPKASQPSGVVVKGTKIALTCSTADSTIYYKLSKETEEWQTYSTEIVIDEATTIYAKAGATAAGLKESEVVTFAYTVPTMPPEVKDDPITSIPDGAISIEDALKAPDGETVTVVGQLVYRFGNYNNTNSAILEDVVGGQVVALQIYNSLDDYQIGDILKITAKKETRSGVIQISSASKIEVVTKAEEAKLIPAQEFNSIVELLASKEYLLSEWVKIKNITLNTYNSNGNTQITDSFGNTMAVYRAAAYPYGVEPGEVVDVYACVSKYNKTDQLRLGSSRDYVVVNDTKAPNIEFESTELKAGLLQDLNITVAIRDNVGVKEAKLAYTAGSNQPVELSLKQDTEDRVKWKGTIPGAVFVAGVDKVTVKVFAEDVNGNKGEESVAVKVIDEPQVVKVTPARNAITGDDKRPLISVTCFNVGTQPTATLTLKKGTEVVLDQVPMGYQSETFSYQVASDLAEARYTASVTVTRADGKSITYEWPFTTGTPEYRLYFGQLHSHTTYSDGSGTLDSALEYVNQISEKDNIDFVAFTDHSNYFDTKDAVNPEDGLYDTSKMTADSQRIWKEYKTKVATYNASPSNRGVVAVAGYEMTWSGGPGHMNTFNTPGVVSRNNKTLNNKTNDAGMKAYYALLSRAEGENSISQFNHPGTTFGTFADFGYWDTVIDSRINMVEVGNGEGAIGSGGHFPSYNYYTMALDKGWHVAPTNNQDNHKGKWGNANDARDVIITDSLTEENIYQAMRERRIYATEDKNLEITYTVNDKMMGTIIEEVPESLTIKASLSDADDTIEKAELIANSGRVVYKWDVNAQSKELTATLNPDY